MKTAITILSCLLLCLPQWIQGQNRSSVIRGTIIDQDTRQPLPGATVLVQGLSLGANTDENGKYRITNVPVGRHVVEVRYIGYAHFVSEPQVINSAKETVLDIEMVEEVVTSDMVEITVSRENPDAPVSLTKIDVEHSAYKPGAISDPGRMMMAEAGVSQPQDNNSDIVIRGNSPAGLLWRLEGIDIPNPNHFARKGSSGGGITIFSAQVLGESSFSTGAFNADYGNALAGAFDMKFRKGNTENREYRFKAGLLGLDFATEGPISNGRSSYLINYRYSTLGILNDLGFRLVGKRIDNNFQDLSFNVYLPTKNDKGVFTLFGIGGLSEELWDPVKDSVFYANRDYRTTTDFTTNMGATGLTYTHFLSDKSYLKWVVAAVGSRVVDNDDTLNLSTVNYALPNDESAIVGVPEDSVKKEDYRDYRFSTHLFYNNKINQKVNFRAGLIASHIQFAFDHRELRGDVFQSVVQGQGSSQLLQGYSRVRYDASHRLTLNAGLHALFLVLNQTYSIEPRLSMSYVLTENDRISVAYGLHGQALQLGNYFTQTDAGMPNQDLEMTQAHHAVVGYEHSFTQAFRLKVEGYYQYLFNLPVVNDPTRSYMLLNERDGYAREALVSEGTGRNYGVDMSVRQAFARGSFLLLAGSVYKSEYMTLFPDRWFSTRFDSRYNLSLMGGKEWYFGKEGQSSLQISGRGIFNGGLRYSPIDREASAIAAETSIGQTYVPIDAEAWTEKVGDYYRLDLRIAYRINGNKAAHLISIDAQNATNHLNRREPIYDPISNNLTFRSQSGLIPVISYQIDF